jgi:predicted transcriptional regulator
LFKSKHFAPLNFTNLVHEEITLKEIAAELGISITTVSKALKNYQMLVRRLKAVIELAQNIILPMVLP